MRGKTSYHHLQENTSGKCRRKSVKTKGGITASLIAPQYVPSALDDDDDDHDVCDDDDDDDDNDGDEKLTIIMKWLNVLPWKGSRSSCQQKTPCRTVAMLSADVFLACLDKWPTEKTHSWKSSLCFLH